MHTVSDDVVQDHDDSELSGCVSMSCLFTTNTKLIEHVIGVLSERGYALAEL